MNWIQTITMILSILIPMFAGFGWIINKIMEMQRNLSDDIRKLDNRLSDDIKKLDNRLSDDIRKLDNRLSRIEGYIEGKNQKIIGE